MKVLLATQKPFAASAVAGIREIVENAGFELALLEKYAEESDLIAAVADVDAMIVRSDKVTAAVVAAASKLKIVVRAGAGYDNLDLEALSAAGIVAMNTPGQNSNAVAELAIAMMIYMARNAFSPSTGTEIMGKTLGIQGFGHIGRLIASKANALGMKVKAYAPSKTAEYVKEGGAEQVHSLEELYSGCDYVSVNIPANQQTAGCIGYDLLASMPVGAVLVNTARKEVVDEAGLARALTERTDLKYATDVAPSNLAELQAACGSRIFATAKKMGAQTAEANINAGLAAADQIVDFLTTGNTKFQVNRK